MYSVDNNLVQPGNSSQPTSTWQFFVTFLGWLSDPSKWLSDLQLGDKKVTLNHLVYELMLGPGCRMSL